MQGLRPISMNNSMNEKSVVMRAKKKQRNQAYHVR